MLDTDTKRRIDTARDILVGKVPDPKSQVEQITIALIYKFMDDMDAESEELGGKRSFFANEFARYGWAKLMRSGLGGFETLNLYAEAIAKMPENPGIPPLFRDIFKNAYLPYRDPETLRAFLKIIDEFNYDHSERLGDAFEYLLSVLGSQGDAGQFRTPRHIIDFMVEIVDPKQTDTVLAPACGTAGFLISSYKHILRVNTDTDGNSTLTPDEKVNLAQNFTGYDISPDMVRLSLVNMYLHGFAAPHIAEYDTLTSLDRWNEYADVILANPPFMSPRGGIRPHNRFSVQSTRSEVLFVDYMAEHLKPAGRAGIIVPEGVVFQSQTAYTRLRKMLVEQSLVAVVSMPSGVFNPYSGVKTCILILDKSLANRADTIAFFKVENDGFGLGAQRRGIDKNDLPVAQTEIGEYLHRLRAGNSMADFQPTLGQIVQRARIATSGDYNLGGERYRESHLRSHRFPLLALGDPSLFRVESGGTPKSEVAELWDGGVPWATLVDLPATDFITDIVATRRTISERGLRESSAKLIPVNSVIVSTRATIGRIGINRVPIATNQGFKNIVIQDPTRAIAGYVALAVTRLVPTMEALASGGTFKEISKSRLCELAIPLPPIDVQQEIVAEIEGYQKVIDGARGVVDNYRPRVPVDPEWPRCRLADIADLITKGTTPTSVGFCFVASGVRFIKVESISGDGALIPAKLAFISERTHEALKRSQLAEGDVLFSIAGALGRTAVIPGWVLPANTNQALELIRLQPGRADPTYVSHMLRSEAVLAHIQANKAGVAQYNLSLKQVGDVAIPLPPIPTQQAIVAAIEAEQTLVAANRELITRFEGKIEATLARVWGEGQAGQVGV